MLDERTANAIVSAGGIIDTIVVVQGGKKEFTLSPISISSEHTGSTQYGNITNIRNLARSSFISANNRFSVRCVRSV